jgi:hypothetical protein
VTGYGLDDGVQFQAGIRDFSLFHSVQTGFGDSLPGDKAARGLKAATNLQLVPRSRMTEL